MREWKADERCETCGCKPHKYKLLKEKDQQRKFSTLGDGISNRIKDERIAEFVKLFEELQKQVSEILVAPRVDDTHAEIERYEG